MEPKYIDKLPVWWVENAAKVAKKWLDDNKGTIWSDVPRIGFREFAYNIKERDGDRVAEAHVVWCRTEEGFKYTLHQAYLNSAGRFIYTKEPSEVPMEESGQLLMF